MANTSSKITKMTFTGAGETSTLDMIGVGTGVYLTLANADWGGTTPSGGQFAKNPKTTEVILVLSNDLEYQQLHRILANVKTAHEPLLVSLFYNNKTTPFAFSFWVNTSGANANDSDNAFSTEYTGTTDWGRAIELDYDQARSIEI